MNNNMRHIFPIAVLFALAAVIPFHSALAAPGDIIWKVFSTPTIGGCASPEGAITSIVADGTRVYTGEGDSAGCNPWPAGAWNTLGAVRMYSASDGSLLAVAPTVAGSNWTGVFQVRISGDYLYVYIPGGDDTWRETRDKYTLALISSVPDSMVSNCSSGCSLSYVSGVSAFKRYAFRTDSLNISAYHLGTGAPPGQVDPSSMNLSIGGTVYTDSTWKNFSLPAPSYTTNWYLGVEAIALSPAQDAIYVGGSSFDNSNSANDFQLRLEKIELPPLLVFTPSVVIWTTPSTVSSGSNTALSWQASNIGTGTCMITASGAGGFPIMTGQMSSFSVSVGPFIYTTTINIYCERTSDSAGAGASTVVTVSNPPPINGSCYSIHYGCNAGASVSNVDGVSSWTWACEGLYGGTTANCSETKPLPDLTAGATTATPPFVTSGQADSFSANVSNNIGTGAASNFPNVFQIANSDLSTTIARVNTGTVASLAAGASTPISSSYIFSSPGTYNVRACANMDTSGNTVITESDTTNNCGAWQSLTVVSPPTGCSDGNDDDNNGWIDYAGGDPGCSDPTDPTESNTLPQCSDQVDNDGDGYCDAASGLCLSGITNPDPDCTGPSDNSETTPQCSDGIDNDGDGKIDFGSLPSNDTGCTSNSDNTERNFQFREF